MMPHYLSTAGVGNLSECAGLVGEYESDLSKFLIEVDGARLGWDGAVTSDGCHIHVTADVTTVTQPDQLQTTTSNQHQPVYIYSDNPSE